MIKLKDILKLIIEEAEVGAPKQNPAFEEDPLDYILTKYKKLTSYLKTMMGDQFREYVGGVFIVSGKPTTFKVLLKNGQYFYMTYMGKTYEANVLGKRYYLMNLGEIQMATNAISRILRYGNVSKAQGPDDEIGPRSDSMPNEEPAEAPAEETPAEA
jgi:hypothetical protein